MKLGVLDIGSNCAQLQIVDATPGAPPLPALAIKEPTRLAEELEDGALSEAGTERVVHAVCQAMVAARQNHVEELFVYATSAIRDASNRDSVLDRIEAEAGIRPQFLTGEDEARLTYAAAHRWYGWAAGRILLLDIGGGSLEIALGRDAKPELALSLPLGAGRLTRAFLPDDPPSRAQLRDLRRHVRSTLREISDRLRWEGHPARVVATSKTFKQLARVCGAAPQRKGPFVHRELQAADLRRLVPELAARPAAKRAKLRGISAGRAGQIVAGAVVAEQAMKAFDLRSVELCPWALREGVILRYLAGLPDQVPDLHLQPVRGAARPDDAVPLRPVADSALPTS
ncbi:Ppx/GppA phosphatase family protein [Amycolatopsis sp. 195334CR]|uniref:Ppx/GppA phosphatase family protein n=1 Tax=Amycolatopsis sp. 195334CR TaxID=2814588 RepID=UPI001A9008B1|nr:Ppx/GppA phosphatase family protein [Amycolatopsis sp. 195334CR]MBN6041920.1 Ppx/GppA family phosphatase [Amycolatopsis sp. 195334CR]